LNSANVASVAQAPSGMEVEELTGKDILAALRNKVSAADFAREKIGVKKYEEKPLYGGRSVGRGRRPSYRDRQESPVENYERKDASDTEVKKMQEVMSDIEGTKAAVLLDDKMETIRKVSANDLQRALRSIRAYAVVFDGQVSGYVLNAAERAGIKHLGAKSFASLRASRVNLVSL